MQEALLVWVYNLQLSQVIERDRLDLTKVPPVWDMRSESGEMRIITGWNQEMWKSISRNSFITSIGLCAIVYDRAMDEAFGRKGSNFPESQKGLVAARAIIYQARNAFAHDPVHPVWAIKNPLYNKVFRVVDNSRKMNLEVNLAELDGRDFVMAHIGGWKSFMNLLFYCQGQVTAKEAQQ